MMHRSATLVGAAILSACADSSPLTTSPVGRATATGIATELKTIKDKGDALIVSSTGDILPAVTQYRTLLGANNGAVEGEQNGGRREVNWDGVDGGGAQNTNNEAFPGNFFNVNSKRGAVFTTPSGLFRISNNGYTDINPSYAGLFNTFSPTRLFVARGSTITDTHFFVAGTNTPAVVAGFGSVFADVGHAHSTTIEFYGVDGQRLLTVVAPRRSDDRGLSFVGAVFESPVVAWVRVTSGDTPVGPDDNVKGAGQKRDIVAMDDFIYGEPHAIR